MHVSFRMKISFSASFLLTTLVLPSLCLAQAPVLKLPELVIHSIRGSVGINDKTTKQRPVLGATQKIFPPEPGQAFAPVHVLPGTRLFVSTDYASHVIVSLPGAGACLAGTGSSLRLPTAEETDMTMTFDGHLTYPNKLFMNISAAELAKQGGAVFRFKNKNVSNSDTAKTLANVVFSTTGGRFFVIDGQFCDIASGRQSVPGCTVGVFEGSVSVDEMDSGQKVEVKPGSAVLVKKGSLGQPRPLTKAETAYDIGCKIASLGKESPARLPASMKTTPKPVPGGGSNSLGMVFVPVPGSKLLVCAHETRGQDFAAYVTANPGIAEAKPRGYAEADVFWGWEDHPVTTTWDEAAAFCAWLSQKEGRKYRLPTEKEWEKVAGIGGPVKPPTKAASKKAAAQQQPGPVENGRDISFNAEEPAEDMASFLPFDDGYAQTAPVMSFPPNKLGVHDLAGNVVEWCEDWYDASRQGRVVRGGSFREASLLDVALATRVSTPTTRQCGFRVVMELP